MGRTLLLTHLHPGSEQNDIAQRELQMGTIEKYSVAHPGSHILAGDLNTEPPDRFMENWRYLGGEISYTTATDEYENLLKGISKDRKLECLDHILFKTSPLQVPIQGATTFIDHNPMQGNAPLSDHAPVLTTNIPKIY
jgi:endonuclease/exonuclease/phosphatase (EEP) superfamily protein YafD